MRITQRHLVLGGTTLLLAVAIFISCYPGDELTVSETDTIVTVFDKKGARVGRFGGPTFGEKPGEFTAPHTVVTDSHGDVYVGEVAYTSRGQHENPPREIRSLQKFKRLD